MFDKEKIKKECMKNNNCSEEEFESFYNTKREKLTSEDIEFLEYLQYELLTQSTNMTTNPRYWIITEEIEVPREDGEYTKYILDNETWFDNLDKIVEKLREELSDEALESYRNEKELMFLSSEDRLINIILEDLEEEHSIDIYRYDLERRPAYRGAIFLIKKNAEKHIELNNYHYKNPKIACEYAWRSPEVEKLIDLITTVDLDDLKRKIEEE